MLNLELSDVQENKSDEKESIVVRGFLVFGFPK